MATYSAAPKALNWGRGVNGRFFIDTCVDVQLEPGKMARILLEHQELTPEEEEKLRAALGGITIASTIPQPRKDITLVH